MSASSYLAPPRFAQVERGDFSGDRRPEYVGVGR